MAFVLNDLITPKLRPAFTVTALGVITLVASNVASVQWYDPGGAGSPPNAGPASIADTSAGFDLVTDSARADEGREVKVKSTATGPSAAYLAFNIRGIILTNVLVAAVEYCLVRLGTQWGNLAVLIPFADLDLL